MGDDRNESRIERSNSVGGYRRQVLRATAGSVFFGVAGVGTIGSTTEASADGVKRWDFETGGPVEAAPTVVEGTVYVGSDDGYLYALNSESGDEAWNLDLDYGLSNAPMLVDGTLYMSDRGLLNAVDPHTGEQEWFFDTAGGTRSPAIADGICYTAGGRGVHAVDLEEAAETWPDHAEEEWHFETDDFVTTALTYTDGDVYFGGRDAHVYALDVETGEPRWEFEIDDEIHHSAPTVADGTVVAPTSAGTVYGIDQETGDERWTYEIRFSRLRTFTAPTVADGTVYVGSVEDALHALDLETGDERWTFEADDDVDGSAPTVADDTVFVGSDDGNVYGVDVDTGEETWRFETGDEVRSSPTVVDGSCYVGSDDGNVYALETNVAGSSRGSRVRLATHGHHHDAVAFDHGMTADGLPGAGIVGTLAALGGAGYLLLGRGSDVSDR